MRLIIACVLVFIGYAHAQSCNSAYGSYLNCIKGQLDNNYGAFEREFGSDYANLVWGCFTSDPQKANTGDACYMRSIDVLNNAFNDQGALAQCSFCQKIAGQVRKMIVDAPEGTLQCVRKHIRDAIGTEMEYCIRKSRPSFTMPSLPDFDASSAGYREMMIDNAGKFIMTDFSLDRCERISAARGGNGNTRGKRSSIDNTRSCINNRMLNGRPIWAQHCNAVKTCRAQSVSSSCTQDFAATERAACDCVEEGRQKIQDIITEAGGEIIGLAQRNSLAGVSDSCVDNSISNDVFRLQEWKECKCQTLAERILNENSKRVDLRKIYQRIMDCTNVDEETRNLIKLDNLIRLGCKRVARGGSAGEKSAFDLASAIKFASQLVDALTARVTRFCPGTHCRP